MKKLYRLLKATVICTLILSMIVVKGNTQLIITELRNENIKETSNHEAVDAASSGFMALPITNLASIIGPTQVCVGSTIQLSDSITGGIWTSLNSTVANINTSGLVTGVTGGTAIINYVINNANGSISSQSTSITVVAPVVLICEGVTGSQYSIAILNDCRINACLGQNLWLSVNPNRLSGIPVSWTGPNGYAAASINSGNDIYVTAALTKEQVGVYTATYTNGVCTSSVSISVVENTPPVVVPTTGNNNTCIGDNTQLSNVTLGGVWKSGCPDYATVSSTGLVSGIVAGNIYIYYTVTDISGCATVEPFLVSINSPFILDCEVSTDNQSYKILPKCSIMVCKGSPQGKRI